MLWFTSRTTEAISRQFIQSATSSIHHCIISSTSQSHNSSCQIIKPSDNHLNRTSLQTVISTVLARIPGINGTYLPTSTTSLFLPADPRSTGRAAGVAGHGDLKSDYLVGWWLGVGMKRTLEVGLLIDRVIILNIVEMKIDTWLIRLFD